MRITITNPGFTSIELVMAVALSVVLMTGVYGFFTASNQSYSTGVSAQNLQGGVNTALSKIIEGETESGTVYRLSTAVTYTVACTSNCAPNPVVSYTCGGNQQNSPCNTNNPFGELYFCQDDLTQNNPAGYCNYNDATARWYYLNSAGTAVIYHHPKTGGGTIEETLYTAPTGSTLTLRFSGAAVNNSSHVVEIDIALTQILAANITNKKLAVSGAASTFVLLRGHT